jgi:hypothetical protein
MASAAGMPDPPRCPGCRQPLDDKGRCWRCNTRRCKGCGKDTGSAFLRWCLVCVADGLDAQDEEP